MGAAAVGAVGKDAVRPKVTNVPVKSPPSIVITQASLLGLAKVPALTVPEVSRNALLAPPKVDVPLEVNEPPFTRKPCPPKVVPLMTPPVVTASVPPLQVVVPE